MHFTNSSGSKGIALSWIGSSQNNRLINLKITLRNGLPVSSLRSCGSFAGGSSQGPVSTHLRDRDLLVREERTGRRRGGKTLQVHVDSLPADLREAGYLERGVVLHEKPDAETGNR
ncbi:hypothetical protein [Phaeobacter porticola]|uniref:hypothetical protein n=1 Tax=Phaeobacter porticola TaxID=1844006 RepID=UPI000931AB77|nr:hypothetical protein [Phaeobacter porticola]